MPYNQQGAAFRDARSMIWLTRAQNRLQAMKENCISRLRPHLAPVLLIVAATFAVYARALGHDFLTNWDDHLYVTDNEAVRGFTTEHLRAAFTRFFAGNYAPIQIISYMADYSLWKLRPAGYVLTNVVLHAAN